MNVFKFEITFFEEDLEGDEFWEEALKRDGTGIAELTKILHDAVDSTNLLVTSDRTLQDTIKLKYFGKKTVDDI